MGSFPQILGLLSCFFPLFFLGWWLFFRPGNPFPMSGSHLFPSIPKLIGFIIGGHLRRKNDDGINIEVLGIHVNTNIYILGKQHRSTYIYICICYLQYIYILYTCVGYIYMDIFPVQTHICFDLNSVETSMSPNKKRTNTLSKESGQISQTSATVKSFDDPGPPHIFSLRLW